MTKVRIYRIINDIKNITCYISNNNNYILHIYVLIEKYHLCSIFYYLCKKMEFFCVIEQDKENDSRNAQATQAVIQRRRRPKRRSTGVVHVDMDVSKNFIIELHFL